MQHKTGKLHVVPDTSSRIFAFEQQQEIALPSLAPISLIVPDYPRLQSARPCRPYQSSACKVDDLEPVRSDGQLFSVKSVFASATNFFMSVDQEKVRSAQAEKYGPNKDYILNAEAPLPEKDTKTTMSYYSVQDGLVL